MFKKALSVLLCLIILFSFAGCTANKNIDTTESISLAILLSNNSTFPGMNDGNIESLYGETLNAYMSGGQHEGSRVSVVILDGNPYVPINDSIDVIKTNITQSKRESKAKNSTVKLLRQSIQSPALSEEVDLLKGLTIAAQLANSGEAKKKRVVVYANGLQTTGVLNMLNSDLLNCNVDMLCDELTSKSIVNFKGIEFVWAGIGCVSANSQQQIPTSLIPKLKAFWQSIIEKAGGNVVFKDHYISGDSDKNLPKISTVPFAPDKITATALYKKFEEDTIKFVADDAVFFDPKAAKAVLEPIAVFLKQNTSKRIIIVGTTASIGEEKSCVDLSRKRADTCKNTLIEMGVDENQIETLGMGRKKSFLRVNDLDINGGLVEELAVQNRAIYIFDANSDDAKNLYNID